MASESILHLDELLQPISEDNPVGNDIREDSSPTSPYYAIKDARNAARAAERNNMFDNDSSEAEDQWRKVAELGPDILTSHTKDLEIASWLTEALVRRHGFRGLRDGFKLINGLIDQFWDDIYPLPDEDGIETRVASLTGLNGEGAEGVLIAPIRNVTLTEGSDPGPFSYWKYQQALEVDKIIDEDAKAEKASKLGFSMDDIDRAVSGSSDVFFIDLRDDVTEAINTYREVGVKLDELCGLSDAPPTRNIVDILGDCLGAINHIGKYKFPLESSDIDSETEGGENGVSDATSGEGSNVGAATAAGPVRTREEAFKKLTEISEFFRKAEPHSPISYMLERVVKWGSLPLDDLIRELIPDSSARDFYGSLTGINTDDD